MKQFQMIVPPGWFMIDLTTGVDEQVDEFVGLRLASAPRDRARSVRPMLTKSLKEVAHTFADGGAVALTLATDPADGSVDSPTTVFVPLAVPAGQQPIDMLLAVASSDPSATSVDVGDLVGVRISESVDATIAVRGGLRHAAAIVEAPVDAEASALTAQRHHVRYLMGDPGDPERWVDAAFSVTSTSLPGSAEVAEALIELFDETIQSFRWVS
ncbi:MAG: hypothetical protein ACYC1E_03775 [Propionibacteriaceae bacterium]